MHNTYLRDLGRVKTHQGMESMFGNSQLEAQEGYANAPLVLSSHDILRNINRVQ